MVGWDACAMEPNGALRWIECHPGLAGYLQALGVFIAILVAFFAPKIAAWFTRRQLAAERRSNTQRAVPVLREEMRDVLAHCDAIQCAIREQDDLPLGYTNSWSEWFTSVGFAMSNTIALLDQWTQDMEAEPIAPFKRVARLIGEYNIERNNYMLGGPVADCDQWDSIRERLLGAIDSAKRAAAEAAGPKRKHWLFRTARS